MRLFKCRVYQDGVTVSERKAEGDTREDIYIRKPTRQKASGFFIFASQTLALESCGEIGQIPLIFWHLDGFSTTLPNHMHSAWQYHLTAMAAIIREQYPL